MEKEEIIEVLSGWNFWKKDHDTGIPRNGYLDKLERLAATGQVVAITGVRRSGKSTLMKQFVKRQIEAGRDRNSFLYINFEEPKFAGMLSLEFLETVHDAYTEIVKPKETPCLLLDEVQNLPRWERFVRGLHEKREAQVLVSGSTSKLFSEGLAKLLTGRWLELKTYPLDFTEFLGFNGLKLSGRLDILSKRVKIKQMLRQYLEFGGFPLVVLNNEKEEILSRYFEDIIGRDVAERNKVRKTEKLKALARHYLTSFSSSISYRKIAKFIGLSLDSVERFSASMQDAYLILFVPKFSYSLKEQQVNPKKVYCVDSGLINAAGFRFSQNIGRLYENTVFAMLNRKGKEVYYYKGKGECDFVIKEGRKVSQAIQVSYQLGENKEREVRGLLEAMEAFKLSEGLIVTEGFEGQETQRGKKVKYTPLWKWLITGKLS